MSTPDHTPHQQPGSPGPQTTWGHDEPPRRSWFARHKIITGSLVVLGLFIIIGAWGGDEDPADSAAQPSATSTSSAEEGADSSASSSGSTADESAAEEAPAESSVEEGTTEAEEAPDEETAEAPAEEAGGDPQLGDVVQIGDFEVSVTGVEGGLAQIGDDMLGEEAQGQFVKVMVTVENTGDAAEYFLDSEQELIDDSDRQHSTSSASWMLDEESLFLTEINPGNRVEGVLLYDIPADAVPTAVDLQGGFFSSPVRVSLGG
ncbi:DUF4352 domain-containing protein [Serinicoccus chungangensis]|uniref:DUF4352 domain-containing protein n=1 Tax=Serinicoccus chungangensis TaxID=767452 RepID=UPI00111AC48B